MRQLMTLVLLSPLVIAGCSGCSSSNKNGFKPEPIVDHALLKNLDQKAIVAIHADKGVVDVENDKIVVYLDKPECDDGSLEHVAKLPETQKLFCTGSAITDAGLAKLKGLENLEHLDVCSTSVTDEGLKFIADLPKLKTIVCRSTSITKAYAQTLRTREGNKILVTTD